MQIELYFNDKRKRLNVNTTITPKLIKAIREIEFEYFYKVGQETASNYKDEIELDGKDYSGGIAFYKDVMSSKEKAYNYYLELDIMKDKCFKLYKYEIIVPIFKLLLLTDGLTAEETEMINQNYEEKDDNFWFNQPIKNLKDFYAELKKNID